MLERGSFNKTTNKKKKMKGKKMNVMNRIQKIENQYNKSNKMAEFYRKRANSFRDQLQAAAQALRPKHDGQPKDVPRHHKMSKEGRARIAEAQKRRWQEWKKTHAKAD